MKEVDGLLKPARRRWLTYSSLLLAGGAANAVAAATGAGSSKGTGTAIGRTILVVGDSLSAEYGLKRGSGWVALLAARLAQKNTGDSVVNASISGDTTAGGRTRLPSLLREHQPDIVMIELGGNDALRGLPLATTRANLTEMTRAAKAAGARVVIVGMQVPPNYGRTYTEEFAGLFAGTAKAEGASLVPFLLAGVADGPQADTLFQADRIHPIASAHPRILDNVWPVLAPMLR